MSDTKELITEYLSAGGMFNPELMEHKKVRDLLIKCRDEINRLDKYRNIVYYIANDRPELSYEKVRWQRNDWQNRANKLIEEDQGD